MFGGWSIPVRSEYTTVWSNSVATKRNRGSLENKRLGQDERYCPFVNLIMLCDAKNWQCCCEYATEYRRSMYVCV